MSDDAARQPQLLGEDWLAALLLQMVLQHCGTAQPDELDSYAITANADAMTALHELGYIEITDQAGRRRLRASIVLGPEARWKC